LVFLGGVSKWSVWAEGGCTPSDQLLNFFALVAEVEVQHKSANFAFSIAP